mgnify:FL=1
MHTMLSRGLIAAALLGMAACGPVAPPAAPQEATAPLVTQSPTATATPMAATQATEAAEPQTQPAETNPAALPEIELVTPKPAPIIQQPVTPTVPQPPAPEATTPAAPAEEVPMPQPPIMTDDVAFALNDLASRLGVAADAISVVRVEEVDWPDGSLGCPQPDMRYTQALVNGTFIQLRAGDQLYNYHSGGRRQPFLCTSKNEVLPEDLPGEMRGNPGA